VLVHLSDIFLQPKFVFAI